VCVAVAFARIFSTGSMRRPIGCVCTTCARRIRAMAAAVRSICCCAGRGDTAGEQALALDGPGAYLFSGQIHIANDREQAMFRSMLARKSRLPAPEGALHGRATP